jgi:hypothetical protein
MLKKMLTGVLAAGAMAVPLAGVAWADPAPNPNPPAAPESTDQGPANPAAPAGMSAGSPVCVVAANPQAAGAQGGPQAAPGATWHQIASLQGSVASDLGVPAGQPMSVFCAPTSSQSPQNQPTGYLPGQPNQGMPNQGMPNQGQPIQGQPNQAPLQQNPQPQGQTEPQNPAPGQTGSQNPAPGQQ